MFILTAIIFKEFFGESLAREIKNKSWMKLAEESLKGFIDQPLVEL